jgi:hypothetical protein
MRRCAYCRDKNGLTKEHIWSNCLLERRHGNRVYSTHAAPAVFVGPNALQIKDVCEKCNSGVLSELDNYFCALYDRCISSIVRKGDSIRFEFDYRLLVRWLLKTLYNNARGGNAGDKGIGIFNQYNDFILQGGKPPEEVTVFLQLVIPSYIDDEEIPPSYMACGPFSIPGFDQRRAETFVLAIDSFRFIIAVSKHSSKRSRRKLQNSIETLPATDGSVLLGRAQKSQLIRASEIDTLHAVGPIIQNDQSKWEQMLQQRAGDSV